MNAATSDFVKKYSSCQRYSKETVKYGHLPPKQVTNSNPWDEVCVDLIVPWKVIISHFDTNMN